MPVPRDHAIVNRMRLILHRRWIDVRSVDFGSVNGVAYVRGELKRSPFYPASRSHPADELLLLQGLERDLRAIPGVKDVSFEPQGFEHEGDHWERNQLRTA